MDSIIPVIEAYPDDVPLDTDYSIPAEGVLSAEDGTSESTMRVVFESQDLMARIAALVPWSRVSLTRIDTEIASQTIPSMCKAT
ncbi:MAG TPA: hypothetical protein VET88_01850 [Gammaproteobacteria bacterium]|nr:hypothetical protein [Gammaproteobacteria bacterium]